MSVDDLKVELSPEELETLHKIHEATAIRQTIQTPGWDLITGIVARMISRLEDQHLKFAPQASRDAYWSSGIRLAGAREFAKILQDQIAKEVDLNLIPPNRERRPEE